MSRRVIRLDVGGVKFKTTASTLAARHPDGFLARLVSREWSGEEATEFFVDRDGGVFRHVLAFLRDGERAALPGDGGEEGGAGPDDLLRRLETEADFYQLPDLVDLVRSRRRSRWPLWAPKEGERVRWRKGAIPHYLNCLCHVMFEQLNAEHFVVLGLSYKVQAVDEKEKTGERRSRAFFCPGCQEKWPQQTSVVRTLDSDDLVKEMMGEATGTVVAVVGDCAEVTWRPFGNLHCALASLAPDTRF